MIKISLQVENGKFTSNVNISEKVKLNDIGLSVTQLEMIKGNLVNLFQQITDKQSK